MLIKHCLFCCYYLERCLYHIIEQKKKKKGKNPTSYKTAQDDVPIYAKLLPQWGMCVPTQQDTGAAVDQRYPTQKEPEGF